MVLAGRSLEDVLVRCAGCWLVLLQVVGGSAGETVSEYVKSYFDLSG